jgi:hypothetical protein
MPMPTTRPVTASDPNGLKMDDGSGGKGIVTEVFAGMLRNLAHTLELFYTPFDTNCWGDNQAAGDCDSALSATDGRRSEA